MVEVRKAIQPFAIAHEIPERFDDPRTTVAPGTSWLYDKLKLGRKR
jgi:hypothetical protein